MCVIHHCKLGGNFSCKRKLKSSQLTEALGQHSQSVNLITVFMLISFRLLIFAIFGKIEDNHVLPEKVILICKISTKINGR